MIVTGQDYAAARQAGASPRRARVELGLSSAQTRTLERAFRENPAPDFQLPRFARNASYVDAVMRQGGFCAFSERRRGRDGVTVCFPLIWPAA